MKRSVLVTVLLAGLLPSSLLADLLRNGDFQEGAKDEKTYSFGMTPGWYNRAVGEKKGEANARVNEGSLDGYGYSATVNDRKDEISSFSQKTEHNIEEGEVFELSLDWTSGWQWQPTDILRVVIFAKSGDKLGGETVWEQTVDFERAPVGSWAKATHRFPPAPTEAVGRKLYFGFYGVDPQEAGTVGWCRVDNIELKATKP